MVRARTPTVASGMILLFYGIMLYQRSWEVGSGTFYCQYLVCPVLASVVTASHRQLWNLLVVASLLLETSTVVVGWLGGLGGDGVAKFAMISGGGYLIGSSPALSSSPASYWPLPQTN